MFFSSFFIWKRAIYGDSLGVYYVVIEAEDILGNTAELENAASFTIEQGVETSTGTGIAYFEPESGSIEDLTAV
ncbi:hypothetical protein J7L06_09530, partial [Candidatus Bathyarchaeota archaeon]|nr:hypothetical protein [Candidatus Bathyarchaeota archaeon]